MRRGERTDPEFKHQILTRMREIKNMTRASRELGISVRTLYRWRDEQLGRKKKVPEPGPREAKLDSEIRQLKQSLAKRTLEVDFFRGALQKVAARRRGNAQPGETASTTRSGS
jgi:transposase-like protein